MIAVLFNCAKTWKKHFFFLFSLRRISSLKIIETCFVGEREKSIAEWQESRETISNIYNEEHDAESVFSAHGEQ